MIARLAPLAITLLALSAPAVGLERPTCVEPFVSGSDMFIVSPSEGKVEAYGFTGELKWELGAGEFKEPTHVAVSAGRIAVCDRGADTIYVYDFDRRLKDKIGRLGPGGAEFSQPYACEYDADGTLFVADTGNNRVVAVDAGGGFLATFGAQGSGDEQLSSPMGIAVLPRGYVAVADTGNNRVQILRFDKAGRRFGYDRTIGGLNAPHGLFVDADQRLLVADTGSNRCLIYDKELRPFGTYCGFLAQGLKGPEDFTVVNGRLAVADTQNGRVLLVHNILDMQNPKMLIDGEVDVRRVDPDKIVIEWETAVPCRGEVEYGITEQYGNVVREDRLNTKHRLALPNLASGRTFHYRISPAVSAIGAPAQSEDLVFCTHPGEGKTWILNLPVMALVYRNTSYRDKYPADDYPTVPEGRFLSDEEVAQVRKILESFREFYHRNSLARVNIALDVHVVDEPLTLKECDGYLGPGDRVVADFDAGAAAFGKKPEDYVAVIGLYAWENYVDDQLGIKIRQNMGGGTYGLDGPWKYKSICYCGIPLGRGLGDLTRFIIIHEFHHALDSLVGGSGFHSYPHADMPIPFQVACGGNYDFNARILRYWPPQRWLCMKYGTVTYTADADNDDLADEDPALPFDELRLGSSPHAKDTDDDGLTDLMEAAGGILQSTNPTSPDTDGDGLSDSKDPLPLTAGTTDVAFGKVQVDGRTGLDEWTEVAWVPNTVSGPGVGSARLSMAWDNDRLCFHVLAAKPWIMRIMIDLEDDGWFHSADNYTIEITPQENGEPTVTAAIYDPQDLLPADMKEAPFNAGDVSAVVRTEGPGYVYEVGIPMYGADFALKPDRKISVRVAFLEPAPLKCMGLWYGSPSEDIGPYELDRFTTFTMVKDERDEYKPRSIGITSMGFGPPVLAPGQLVTRKLSVAVTNFAGGPIDANVRLTLPEGWKALPEIERRERVSGRSTKEYEFDLIVPGDAAVGANVVGAALIRTEGVVDEIARSLYVPLDWRLIGPFDNEDSEGFKTSYPPESGVDLSKTYDGAEGSVAWKSVDGAAFAELGTLVDLGKADDAEGPGVWYAATTIVSPSAQTVQLRLGMPGAYKVWVNGKVAAEDALYRDIGAVIDRDIVTVPLEPGANRVLLKVCMRKLEPFRKNGFYFRVTDEKGAAPAGLKSTAGL
jgi:hypothetical protein